MVWRREGEQVVEGNERIIREPSRPKANDRTEPDP